MKKIFLLMLLPMALLCTGQTPNGDFPLFVGQTAASTLVVHPAQTYGPSSPYLVGGNLLSGSGPFTQPAVATELNTIGINVERYPQGTVGNCIHWQTNTCGINSCFISQNAANTDAAFVAILGGRVFGHVVLNEATNALCTGGNTTTDAVGMANDIIVTNNCPLVQCIWWTIDNEQYNSGALTLYCTPNSNQDCYQARFTTFRTALQAQFPGMKVCLDADPQLSGPQGHTWDTHVMIGAFECADAHYYWTSAGSESDAGALLAPSTDFTPNFIGTLKTHLAASGSPNAQIIVGEYSTIPSSYSYQTQSIIQALFNAEMVGEAAQDGVTSLQFHAAVANCQAPISRPGLYGSWLPFTGSQSLSNGSPIGTCNHVNGQPIAGTILAPGSGLQVAAAFMQGCINIIKSTFTGAGGNLSAYACNVSNGYSLMIVNRSETLTYTLTVSVDGHASGIGGNIVQYSKAIFDLTNAGTPIWNGPTTTFLPPWTTNFTLTIPPWSATSVQTG